MKYLLKKGKWAGALLSMVFVLCLMSGLGMRAAAGEWVQTCGITPVQTGWGLGCDNLPLNANRNWYCSTHNLLLYNIETDPEERSCDYCGTQPLLYNCSAGHYLVIHGGVCTHGDGQDSRYEGEYMSHSHTGNPLLGNGCYNTPVYDHTHTGTSAAGGGCYALFQPVISFVGGSGVSGTPPSSITDIGVGGVYTLPNNTFSKLGFEFQGWRLDGGTTVLGQGTSYTVPNISTDITYTAVWRQMLTGVSIKGGETLLSFQKNRLASAITRGQWVQTCGITQTVTSYGQGCNNLPLNINQGIYCIKHNSLMELRGDDTEDYWCDGCPRWVMNLRCDNWDQCLWLMHFTHCRYFFDAGHYLGGFTQHNHTGDPSNRGGCYTTPVYNHTHSGSSTSQGACFNLYRPAISFVDNTGATGSQPSPIVSVNPGGSYTLPSNTFSKQGYTFVGWKKDGNLYQQGSTHTMPTVTTDFSYTAQWKQNLVTVDIREGVSSTFLQKEKETAVTFAATQHLSSGGEAFSPGQTVTAQVTPSGATATYAWQRNGTAIPGATAVTYTIQSEDAGQSLTVAATGTGSFIGTVTSSAVTPKYDITPYLSTTAEDVTYGEVLSITSESSNASHSVNTGSFTYTYSGTSVDGTQILANSATKPTQCGTWTVATSYSDTTQIGTASATTFQITPKDVTLNAGTLADYGKIYDTTLAATYTGTPGIVGLRYSDGVTATGGTLAFADANAAAAISMTATGFALSGVKAVNYVLTDDTVSGLMGEITPAPLTLGLGTLSIEDKTYDGGTTASFTGLPSFTGLFSGDEVTVTGGTAEFLDKDVGNVVGAMAKDFTLIGSKSENYAIPTNLVTGLTGEITPLVVTLSPVGIDPITKEYDGTTAIASFSGNPTVIEAVALDDVTATGGSLVYTDENADPAVPITGAGFTLTGADAANYNLADDTVGGFTGEITPADGALNPDLPGAYDALLDFMKHIITNVNPTLGDVALPEHWDWGQDKTADILANDTTPRQTFDVTYLSQNPNYQNMDKTVTLPVSHIEVTFAGGLSARILTTVGEENGLSTLF